MPAPPVRVLESSGVCACGNTGETRVLLIDSLPLTMPICPICFKREAGKVLRRLAYRTKPNWGKRKK